MTVESALERLRGEYREMPGLRLTVEQVERLCGIDHVVCEALLDALVATRVLQVNPDGTYARLTDGPRHRHSVSPSGRRMTAQRR